MPLNGLLLVVLIITYLALVNPYSSVRRIIMFHHHMKTEVGNIHTAVTTTGARVHFLLYWLSLDATVYGLDMRPYVLYSYTTIFTYGLFPFSAITKWPAWIHTSTILHHWNRRESSRHLVKTRLTKPYFLVFQVCLMYFFTKRFCKQFARNLIMKLYSSSVMRFIYSNYIANARERKSLRHVTNELSGKIKM